MASSAPTPRIVAAGLLLAAFLIGIAIRRAGRADAPAGPPPAPGRAAPAGEVPAPPPLAKPREAATPPAEPSGDAKAGGAERRLRDFVVKGRAAESAAFAEVQSLLRAKGARAALEHVRGVLAVSADADETDLRPAFLARLIPFIAASDSGTAEAALLAEKELLRSPRVSPWVRFQLLAGLGGAPSTDLIASADEDGSDFSFSFRMRAARHPTPGPMIKAYEESLVGAASVDPDVGLLLASLLGEQSRQVRQAAAAAMGALPVQASPDALSKVVSGDPDARVREEAARALAKLRSPDTAPLLERLLAEDPSPYVKSAALRARAQIGEYDEDAARFMRSASALATERERPAFADAAFEYLKRDPRARDLQPVLVGMLAAFGQERSFTQACLAKALDQGLTEFLPVFRSLQETVPDDGLRRDLADGIRKLEAYPEYAASLDKIRASEDQVNALWTELRAPATSPDRRKELAGSIGSLMGEIYRLKTSPPK
jgi:hypothetical protein